MSQGLLTSNLNADFANGYSKQNNGESNYSTNYPLTKNWDSYKPKSGANYEEEIQCHVNALSKLKIIKKNDTTFPNYYNEHGADLVFINPISGKPVVTECTNLSAKMKNEDMQEKIDLNEKEKQTYQTDESLLIISSMRFLSKKMRLLASQSYTWIIETGWLKLPNMKVWRPIRRTVADQELFVEKLRRQLTKIFLPEKYRQQYERVEQEEKQEAEINLTYKPLMEKEKAAIYKLKNRLKPLIKEQIPNIDEYKKIKDCRNFNDYAQYFTSIEEAQKVNYYQHIFSRSFLNEIKHKWYNNKYRYKRLAELKESLKNLLNKLTKPIKPKLTDKLISTVGEKKWVSHKPYTPYTLSQRKFPFRMKRTNKTRASMSKQEWGALKADRCTFKMTANEAHNLAVLYEKSREEEIREEIEMLKEFGFSKEEILAMYRRC